MDFITNIDLKQNQLLNAIIQNLATVPSSPKAGQIFYNSTVGYLEYYNGTSWIILNDPNLIKDLIGSILTDTNSIDFTYASQLISAAVKRATGLTSGSQGSISENSSGIYVDLSISDGTKAMPGNARLDQLTAPTADVSLNSHKIINLADPTAAQDAVTKLYVDNAMQGLKAKQSVKATTTGANITLSGTQTIDGVALQAGDRVLVKDQTTKAQNGIYYVATGAWGRSSDADTWTELVSAYVFVEQGTTLADTGWLCTVDQGGTLGSTDVTWVQTTGAGQIIAGNGLTKTGNTIDVNVDDQSIQIVSDVVQSKLDSAGAITKSASGIKVNIDAQSMQISSNALGALLDPAGAITKSASGIKENPDGTTIEISSNKLQVKDLGITGTKLANGSVDLTTKVTGTLPIANGGTNASTAAGARSNLGATGKYTTTFGDGSASQFTITHNLNTMDVTVQIFKNASPYDLVMADVQKIDVNSIKILTGMVPTTNQFKVIVTG